MDNLIGIKQIAKLANVSIGTVDRVLHNRPGVSKATREKIKAIIKETGYKKNTVASRLNLAARKKLKIAVLIPEVSKNWSYWDLPKKGIDKAVEELSEMGILVKYYYFTDSLSFVKMSDTILEEKYDGLVTVPFFKMESNYLLSKAKAHNMPIVFLDTEVKLDHSSYFIRQNSHKAGMVGARLLHGLVGSDGIYFVINMVTERGLHANNQQRENGFREFFGTNFNDRDIPIITINHPIDRPFEVNSEIENIFADQRPKGIFVTNARSYLVPNILKAYNVSNVSVVGFDLHQDNLECLRKHEIDFLINQKPEFQGYTAIKGMFKFLTENDSSDLSMDVPVEIIVQENCESI
ncbi:LacI family DNA-binding transcriptional regulator [Arenibacter sp. F20364]|uniref:substrate-binding domain-containing protein n=1 Tax=Arenibacter sp. F20364 TaxID=2926415 RepID=UPI001FF49C67|nr:LacI family DNA-binding transcriptional regulator [Arenibacter sp. F20364]MCK0188669.1 LacI family transcriptional regulator [Arenibacter sp. F20364]